MNIASRSTKIKEKRGTGEKASYKPWIKARELSSLGICRNIIDWKHGRTIELLSLSEEKLYYILRFDNSVTDIREQFPLNLEETNEIADTLGVKRVNKGQEEMTTDLLVDYEDGSQKAFSVKYDRNQKFSPRDYEKLAIEKLYWKAHGIQWEQVYSTELNSILAHNIALCVEYYDIHRVHDDISLVKHFIAQGIYKPDMENQILDFFDLANKLSGEEEWKKLKLMSMTF